MKNEPNPVEIGDEFSNAMALFFEDSTFWLSALNFSNTADFSAEPGRKIVKKWSPGDGLTAEYTRIASEHEDAGIYFTLCRTRPGVEIRVNKHVSRFGHDSGVQANYTVVIPGKENINLLVQEKEGVWELSGNTGSKKHQKIFEAMPELFDGNAILRPHAELCIILQNAVFFDGVVQV